MAVAVSGRDRRKVVNESMVRKHSAEIRLTNDKQISLLACSRLMEAAFFFQIASSIEMLFEEDFIYDRRESATMLGFSTEFESLAKTLTQSMK